MATSGGDREGGPQFQDQFRFPQETGPLSPLYDTRNACVCPVHTVIPVHVQVSQGCDGRTVSGVNLRPCEQLRGVEGESTSAQVHRHLQRVDESAEETRTFSVAAVYCEGATGS